MSKTIVYHFIYCVHIPMLDYIIMSLAIVIVQIPKNHSRGPKTVL